MHFLYPVPPVSYTHLPGADESFTEEAIREGLALYKNIGEEQLRQNLIGFFLSLYDTDGMEGLYVPNSQFRETSKDVRCV